MRERGNPLRARMAAAVLDVLPDWSALAATRIMGKTARMRLPKGVSRAAVAAYVRYFGVELNDVDPLMLDEGFDTFNEFFTRQLRHGARSIDRSPNSVVSPCDGFLREVMRIEDATEVVAKGHGYRISELLADASLAEKFVGGMMATIYLHPRDYHRVHCPTDALARRVTHIPGRLLPVNEAAVEREPKLFALNERIVHVLETGQGWIAVVMVAAFGVGHMSCSYHRFAPHPRELQVHECDPPARLRKGDELGVFHLGSTVLVLTEPGLEIAHDADAIPGRILLGQPIFEEPRSR